MSEINKIKIISSVVFFVIGLWFSYLTYDLESNVDLGEVDFKYGHASDNPSGIAGGGSGVDSADDGVAVGLGIIAGFSLFASALLIGNLKQEHKS